MMCAYGHETKSNGRINLSKNLAVFMVILLIITLILGFYFAFYKGHQDTTTLQETQFKSALSQACQQTPHPSLNYQGVNSFFEYLLQEPETFCPAWKEIQGDGEGLSLEKADYSGRADRRKGTEGQISHSEVLCIRENDDGTETSCLVYSFSPVNQRQTEGHIQDLGCKLHVFDEKRHQDSDFSHSSGNSIRSLVNSTNTSPEDLPNSESADVAISTSEEQPWNSDVSSKLYYEVSGRQERDVSNVISNGTNNSVRSLSLDEITSALGHQGKKIRLLRVDSHGQEWPILRQVVTFHDLVDIQQVSAKVHIPRDVVLMSSDERHQFFADLHQIFEGLNCLGYKVIRSQPYPGRESDLYLPELPDQGLPWSYQVNWMKEN